VLGLSKPESNSDEPSSDEPPRSAAYGSMSQPRLDGDECGEKLSTVSEVLVGEIEPRDELSSCVGMSPNPNDVGGRSSRKTLWKKSSACMVLGRVRNYNALLQQAITDREGRRE
jgi:hypothetical protein